MRKRAARVTMGSHSANGYVNDVPYAYQFTRELTPAWLDLVATLCGFEPPARRGGFAWCELGCGQGVTAAVIAATHPSGDFHAVDAYAPHIEHARRLADNAGVTNLSLHATDFAAAAALDLPRFDYIVAHGVYTWIDARSRADMRGFIERHLRPGGLVYVSYNAMPGWANDGPFQFLLRQAAGQVDGDSIAQLDGGLKLIEALAAVGAPPLAASHMIASGMQELRKRPDSYLTHEFLPTAWQPLYVSQVRGDMAQIGLTPVGTATIAENFDSLVLKPAARDALKAIANDDLRELARDYFLDQRFRRDVFTRGARRVGGDERRDRLLEHVFDLQRPAEQVEYAMETNAGRLTFDNEIARAIIAALATGPKRLADVAADGIARSDALANALVLFAANEIRPVNATVVDVARLNTALADHVGETDDRRFVALPSGTAVAVASELTRETQDRETEAEGRRRWLNFVERYEHAR